MAKDNSKEAKGPILWSVRLREPMALVGSTPTETIEPMLGEGARAGWDVSVSGPSVFLVAPASEMANAVLGSEGNRKRPSVDLEEVAEAHDLGDAVAVMRSVRLAYEVPRAACVLRWVVPGEWDGADVARAVHKAGNFSAVFASPSRELKELRRERPRIAAQRAAEPVRRAVDRAAQPPMPPRGQEPDEPAVDLGRLDQLRKAARAKARGLPPPPLPPVSEMGGVPDGERGWGDPGPVEAERPA